MHFFFRAAANVDVTQGVVTIWALVGVAQQPLGRCGEQSSAGAKEQERPQQSIESSYEKKGAAIIDRTLA